MNKFKLGQAVWVAGVDHYNFGGSRHYDPVVNGTVLQAKGLEIFACIREEAVPKKDQGTA